MEAEDGTAYVYDAGVEVWLVEATVKINDTTRGVLRSFIRTVVLFSKLTLTLDPDDPIDLGAGAGAAVTPPSSIDHFL